MELFFRKRHYLFWPEKQFNFCPCMDYLFLDLAFLFNRRVIMQMKCAKLLIYLEPINSWHSSSLEIHNLTLLEISLRLLSNKVIYY